MKAAQRRVEGAGAIQVGAEETSRIVRKSYSRHLRGPLRDRFWSLATTGPNSKTLDFIDLTEGL